MIRYKYINLTQIVK